jgi:hypothetical protein
MPPKAKLREAIGKYRSALPEVFSKPIAKIQSQADGAVTAISSMFATKYAKTRNTYKALKGSVLCA